jgi:hypothetical protein
MSDYCVVCAPRSGSYYYLKQFAKEKELVNGNEWFGRNKAVDHSKPAFLVTHTVDIDWNVNENLLTDTEIKRRLKHLENFPQPFVIKCMPLQLTNTRTKFSLSIETRLHIAEKILRDFSLIWFQQHDKVSHFCFELTAMACSMPDYPRQREYCTYGKDRTIPPVGSFKATLKQFDKYMFREDFTNSLMAKVDHEVVRYQDMDKTNVIPYPDYADIFTNYEDIMKWFH